MNEDYIALKFTNQSEGYFEGRHGGYKLGDLFLIDRKHYNESSGRDVLRCCYLKSNWCYNVYFDEMSVVDNDNDLNKVIELYHRRQSESDRVMRELERGY